MTDKIYVYYHTHWDREWYLPFRMYQHRLLTVVDTVLDVLEADCIPCFCLDGQTVLLEDYLELRPQNKKRLETLVKADKLSIGPWYVMPDEHLVSGESLIRNLERGLEISKAFGEQTFTGYLPDTFGHSADIPMILKQFNIHSAIVWRGVKPQSSVFQWQSPSGDSVLTYHLTDGYFQNSFHMGKDFAEKKAFFEGWLKRVSAVNENNPLLFPVGADHLGFHPDAPEVVKAFIPEASVVTPDQFMLRIPTGERPVLTGELRDVEGPYILPGVFSSRMYLKQANRKLEWRLTRQLEQLLTWCLLSGIPVSCETELALLWKLLLLNHPHDSICGCSVDAVHRENEVRFEQVDQFSDAMVVDCHHRLLQHFTAEILLFNLSDAPYTGVVEVTQDFLLPAPEATSQVMSEEIMLDDSFRTNTSILPLSENKMLHRKSWVWANEVPAHGLSSTITPHGDTVTVTENSLENQYLRVQVSLAGELTVKDLLTGQFYPGLHQLWRNAEQGDSYNAAPVPGIPVEQAKLTSCYPLHGGPLLGALQLVWRFDGIDLTLQTQVSLKAGSPVLSFETAFINNTSDHKVQVVFTCHQPIQEVIAEGHFSPVTRHYDPDYRIQAAMPAAPQKELKVNAGPLQRWCATQNQTWITEGLAEYEVEGPLFKLTLLRAFGMLSRDDTGVRGSHAGPPLPTPEGQCLNRPFIGRYAWYPGFSVSEASHQADIFYGAVYGLGGGKPGQVHRAFFSWDNPDVISSATLPQADACTLRLVNPTDQPQTVHIATNVTISPFSIQTLRIPLQ